MPGDAKILRGGEKMGGKRELNQDAAILALLTYGSVTEACKHCGVGEATLWRWMQDDEFKAKYREARQRAFDSGLGALVAASVEAVATLRRNLTCGQPSAENAAARAILENSGKAMDTSDVQDRLSALEASTK